MRMTKRRRARQERQDLTLHAEATGCTQPLERAMAADALLLRRAAAVLRPRNLAILAPALLIGMPALYAQTTAELGGSVADSSGGLIPGAKVTLINEQTRDTRVATSDGSGVFTFPALLPSTYDVKVEMKGFQPKEIDGIVLHAGDHQTVPNLALAVGADTQTVTVQANSQMITEDTGERSAVLDAKDIQNLALEGRDTTELLKVLPGATTQSGGLTQNNSSFSDLNVSANESAIGNGISLNGVPNRGGTQLLSDGVSILDPGDSASSISIVSPEMTQEVSVQSANFGADSQFGPVVVSSISKSGGTEYHGEAYFDARNDALNANDWQDDHQGLPKGDAAYYYPGGNGGGPVPFTHKKLFFWGGYERFLQNQGNANVLKSYIPSPEMLAGDFTADNADNQALCPNGFNANAKGSWCNDLSGTVLPNGQVVTNGHIPAQYVSPGAAVLSSFWPKANANPATTPGGYNYYEPVDNVNNGWVYRLRVDYDPTQQDKFYVSYQQAYSGQLAQGNGAHIYWTPGNSIPFPGGGISGLVYTKAISGHYVHIFNSTLTNDFIAAWGYGNFPFSVPKVSSAYKSTLNYPAGYGTVFNGGSSLIPSYSSAGTDTFPDFSQSDIFEDPKGVYEVKKEVPSFTDNLTKTIGPHTVKAGFFEQEVTNIQSNDGTNLNGSISSFGQGLNPFTGIVTGSPNNPTANFVLGNVNGYSESSAAPVSDMAYHTVSFYGNDSWRVSSKVNLVYGARIEHIGHWYDKTGIGMADFFPDRVATDFAAGKYAPGYYWHAIDPKVPLSGQPDRLAYISPRVGAAWDIKGNGDTVVRAGWGAYRFSGQYNDYASSLTTAQTVRSYNLAGQQSVNLSQIGMLSPGNCTANCTSGSQNGLDPNDYGVPLTYAYNVTVDKRLKWNSLLDIAYVGSRSSKILDNGETIEGSDFSALADQNKAPVGSFFAPDPVTGVTSNNPENVATNVVNGAGVPTGNKAADYHRFGYAYGTGSAYMGQSISYSNYNGFQAAWLKTSGKLTYDFNFTWSKTLGTVLQENPFYNQANYGVAAIDRPYVFNSSYTYQAGTLHRFNKVVNGALGGWTISGISTWQAGGSLLAELGNGVPTYGLTETYTNLPTPPVQGPGQPAVAASGLTSAIGDPTYYGTDAPIGIQPVLSCNPNKNLAKYQRLNVACFQAPAVGTYGGQNYPYMSMGSYFDNDLALYKSFHVTERQAVQFRFSAFNWINHPLPEFSSANQVTLYYQVNYNTKAITLNQAASVANNTSGQTVKNFGFMDTKTAAPASRILELNVKYTF